MALRLDDAARALGVSLSLMKRQVAKKIHPQRHHRKHAPRPGRRPARAVRRRHPHLHGARGIRREAAGRPTGGGEASELQPGDVIITAKLDRMFRSALDALAVLSDLQRRGVALHMIDLGGDTTGNGVSKLVFTNLSAVAEAERDRTRERIAEVKRDQKQLRNYLGGKTPWGYEVQDGALVAVPEDQKTLARMQRLRAKGLSLRAIRDRMRQHGIVISHAGVRNALRAAERHAAA
jgi:DNA invertase Pin-like site-specific DNA recombinase